MKRALRKLASATVDFYDSQSGKRISWSQGVQRHGILLSNKHKPADAQLSTIQLGESMEAFTALQLKGVTPRAAALFAVVQAGDEVNAALKLGASGVCINLHGRGNRQKSMALIQLARSLKLDVRCNLLNCFDYRSSNANSQVLDLGILVGELADVDSSTIVLHDGDAEIDIDAKKDALQLIHDELIGIDCVGVPIKQRFGYYSPNAELEQWVADELDIRHRLVFYE